MRNYKLFWLLIFFNISAIADVLKPALVEVTIFNNHIELQILLNLEAVLSNINTNFKNTNNAKNKDIYQELRELSPKNLLLKFYQYQTEFLQNISFMVDGKKAKLSLKDSVIADAGYTKRGRKSVLTYNINIKLKKQFSWQYAQKYGDNAFRWRFYQQDKYTWNTWQIINNKLMVNALKFKPLSPLENMVKFVKTGFYHVIPLGVDHILFIIVMTLSVFLVFGKLLR